MSTNNILGNLVYKDNYKQKELLKDHSGQHRTVYIVEVKTKEHSKLQNYVYSTMKGPYNALIKNIFRGQYTIMSSSVEGGHRAESAEICDLISNSLYFHE